MASALASGVYLSARWPDIEADILRNGKGGVGINRGAVGAHKVVNSSG